MHENSKKTIFGLLITAAVCILLLPLFTLLLQGRFLMQRETAFLGRIHEAHPEWEAEVLEMLFEESDRKEELQSGQEVFLGNGYTEKGPGILRSRLLQKKALLLGSATALIPAAAVVLLMLRLRKLQDQEAAAFSQEKRTLSEGLLELSSLRKQNTRLQEFIENIAHQIKTPLARAMTSMELLQDDTDTEGHSERVSESIAHLEEIRILVERLLMIGRMEAGEVILSADPISLQAMLTEAVSEIPEEDRPELTLNPPEGSFIWNGSYSWTREALRNLLRNCVEHGKGDRPSEITLTEAPEEYRITIRDHGPGFAEEDLPYIFDRFYRPQEEKKGHVGLGLNLAKLIITGQKGELTAGNYPEGGAVFTLFLPRFQEMK